MKRFFSIGLMATILLVALVVGIIPASSEATISEFRRGQTGYDNLNVMVGEINAELTATETLTDTNSTTITQTGQIIRRATLTVTTNTTVIIDGSSGDGWGTVQVGTFPEGQIQVLGFVATGVTMTGDGGDLSITNAGGDFSFGTTGTSDATLDSTDVNLCPSTSCDPLQTAVSGMLASGAVFDGTTTAVPIYMNWKVDDADVAGASTNAVTATASITYINLGDK